MMNNKQEGKENTIITKSIIAPGIAGMVDRSLYHWLDLVINTQQIRSLSFIDGVKFIYQNNGVNSFYKGFKWSLLGSVPDRISMYGSYYGVKYFLSEKLPAPYLEITSGIFSGIIDASTVSSFEAYRARVNNKINVSIPLGMHFRGYSAVLMKCCIANTFSIALSDYTVLFAKDYGITHPALPFAVGFSAGGMTQLLVTPIDNVKSRMMVDYQAQNKIKDIAKKLYLEGGFYNSFWSRTSRIALGTGTMMEVIDYINSFAIKKIN